MLSVLIMRWFLYPLTHIIWFNVISQCFRLSIESGLLFRRKIKHPSATITNNFENVSNALFWFVLQTKLFFKRLNYLVLLNLKGLFYMCWNFCLLNKYLWESTAESSKFAFKEYYKAIVHVSINHKCIILNHAIGKPDEMERYCW